MSEYTSKITFVDGLRVFKPKHPPVPEFIILNFLADTPKLIAWLKTYGQKGDVRFDLKKSKEGKLYLALNDYKPKNNRDDREIEETMARDDINEALSKEITPESLPF